MIADIPLAELHDPKNLMRFVDKASVDYAELVDSMREVGLLNAILVRTRASGYEVVDGMHRATAARDLGWATIPAIVEEISDEEVLIRQVQANAIRAETKPTEYAAQLQRIIKDGMSRSELAVLLKKSPTWISSMLGLLNLEQPIQQMVNRGDIPLTNAILLARMPRGLRAKWVEAARKMNTKDFRVGATEALRKFQEGIIEGSLDPEPKPYLRSLANVMQELELKYEGPLVIASEECGTAIDGFYAALRWVVNMDQRRYKERRKNKRHGK